MFEKINKSVSDFCIFLAAMRAKIFGYKSAAILASFIFSYSVFAHLELESW